MMRQLLAVGACFSFGLVLSACNMADPMPMGRGYSSYNQVHKSASGAQARDVGYAYSNEANEVVINEMRYAARDLVEKLDQSLSFNVDTIYLSIPAHTAFYTSFDHVLREELTKRGYVLSDSPVDAVVIELVVKDDIAQCDSYGSPFFVALAIDVMDHKPSNMVSGFYDLPPYDYISAGHVKIDAPVCHADESAE